MFTLKYTLTILLYHKKPLTQHAKCTLVLQQPIQTVSLSSTVCFHVQILHRGLTRLKKRIGQVMFLSITDLLEANDHKRTLSYLFETMSRQLIPFL